MYQSPQSRRSYQQRDEDTESNLSSSNRYYAPVDKMEMARRILERLDNEEYNYNEREDSLYGNDSDLYSGNEVSFSEHLADMNSSRELLRESKLTRMEAKIGLMQSNLTELRDEMKKLTSLTNSPQDRRKSTKELKEDLERADRMMRELEEDEERIEQPRFTPSKEKVTPKKSPKQTNNSVTIDDRTDTLIDNEMSILKRIYADNLDFLLVVLKEMKFMTTTSSRMECLDFLYQIRKKEEQEIEKLKSPQSAKNSSMLSANRSLNDGVSVSTSLRVQNNSDTEKSIESVSSDDNDSYSVTEEIMRVLTTKIEEIVVRMVSEKREDGSAVIVTKGDVVHLCRELYSILTVLDMSSDIDLINTAFDVLELYIDKEIDQYIQEDIIMDIMDIIATFMMYYRAVEQLLEQTKHLTRKKDKDMVEERLERMRQKRQNDLESIIQKRTQYFVFLENKQQSEKADVILNGDDDTESSFIDNEEEDEESSFGAESGENNVENLVTIEDLLGEEDNATQQNIELPLEIIGKNTGHKLNLSNEQRNSPKNVSRKSPQKSDVLRQLGFNINEDSIKRRRENEEADMEIQFLSRISGLASQENQLDRDYSDFADTFFRGKPIPRENSEDDEEY